MTPAAPTATWRRVCEEYFSRLIEDLEQGVESEVESRVTAAMEAAVRGAVTDAIVESRRALAEETSAIGNLKKCSECRWFGPSSRRKQRGLPLTLPDNPTAANCVIFLRDAPLHFEPR